MLSRDSKPEEIKAEWIRRLRSGEYEQGSDYLQKDGKFCCLGILCEVAVEAGVIGREKHEFTAEVGYGAEHEEPNEHLLPDTVVSWAGLADNNPCVEGVALSSWNDRYEATFDQIADKIEAHL